MSDWIMALDPSSKAIGFACMASKDKVIDAGVIRPDKVTTPPWQRIRNMSAAVVTILAEFEPRGVIIETPSGHVGKKTHKGGGAGLPIYGCGVGYVVARADDYCAADPDRFVETIDETIWTGGVPKRERQAVIALMYHDYTAALDKAADAADAIGLGRWWFVERRRIAAIARADNAS